MPTQATGTISVGLNTTKAEQQAAKFFNQTRQFNVAMNHRGPSFVKMSRDVDRFSHSLEIAESRVLAFGATTAAVYGAIGGFQALVRNAVQVEKSLADVNIILQASSKNLKIFKNELFSIGNETGQSFYDVAEAAKELSRQGLGVEETLKRTKNAFILSRQSGMDFQNSLEAISAALFSFQRSALTSSDIVNKLAVVDAAFAVSSSDLAEAIKRSGSSAEDASVQFDELLGVVTAAQQITQRGGSVIGNALKSIFTRLNRVGTVSQLKSMGVELNETQTGLEKLQAIADAIKLNPQFEAQMKELTGGVYQINIVSAILKDLQNQFGITSKAISLSNNATSEAIIRNEELNKTLATLANKTMNKFIQAASKFGEIGLEPGIRKVLDTINDGLDSFNKDDAGYSFGEGLIKGMGNYITGPGLVLFTGILAKLSAQIAMFANNNIKGLFRNNDLLEKEKHLRVDINNVLAQQPLLVEGVLNKTLSIESAEARVLQILREQNKQRAQNKAVVNDITNAILGIPVKGGGAKKASGGFIPKIDKIGETVGAYNAGYTPGNIRSMNVKGMGRVVYNDRERVVDFGFDQPAIIPPKSSKAGSNYKTEFKNIHGFDPYKNMGMIPNFNIGPMARSQEIAKMANYVPQKTTKAYKLVKVGKDGKFYPLFVKHGEENSDFKIGEWIKAKSGGMDNKGKVESSIGGLAYRPGFHAGDLPIAHHIGKKIDKFAKKPQYRPNNQMWAEIEMANDLDWQTEAKKRGRITKKGTLDLKTAHITDMVPHGGHYRYKTNPHMTGEWLIGGEMNILRLLNDEEVKKINSAHGVSDLPRIKELSRGIKNKKGKFRSEGMIPSKNFLKSRKSPDGFREISGHINPDMLAENSMLKYLYSDLGKSINIDYISSLQKGDAFKMFSSLIPRLEKARGAGVANRIYSSSLVPRSKILNPKTFKDTNIFKNGKIQGDFKKLDSEQLINLIFPQLRYRQTNELETLFDVVDGDRAIFSGSGIKRDVDLKYLKSLSPKSLISSSINNLDSFFSKDRDDVIKKRNKDRFPNFASLKSHRLGGIHRITGHINPEVLHPDSSLRYDLDRDRLDIDYMESMRKGDGFKMFGGLVDRFERLRRLGSVNSIYSSSIVSQLQNNGKEIFNGTDISPDFKNLNQENLLNIIFPQLRYRQTRGLDTIFDAEFLDEQSNFKKLESIRKDDLLKVIEKDPSILRQVGQGDFSIRNLHSFFPRDEKKAFRSTGLIPNFANKFKFDRMDIKRRAIPRLIGKYIDEGYDESYILDKLNDFTGRLVGETYDREAFGSSAAKKFHSFEKHQKGSLANLSVLTNEILKDNLLGKNFKTATEVIFDPDVQDRYKDRERDFDDIYMGSISEALNSSRYKQDANQPLEQYLKPKLSPEFIPANKQERLIRREAKAKVSWFNLNLHNKKLKAGFDVPKNKYGMRDFGSNIMAWKTIGSVANANANQPKEEELKLMMARLSENDAIHQTHKSFDESKSLQINKWTDKSRMFKNHLRGSTFDIRNERWVRNSINDEDFLDHRIRFDRDEHSLVGSGPFSFSDSNFKDPIFMRKAGLSSADVDSSFKRGVAKDKFLRGKFEAKRQNKTFKIADNADKKFSGSMRKDLGFEIPGLLFDHKSNRSFNPADLTFRAIELKDSLDRKEKSRILKTLRKSDWEKPGADPNGFFFNYNHPDLRRQDEKGYMLGRDLAKFASREFKKPSDTTDMDLLTQFNAQNSSQVKRTVERFFNFAKIPKTKPKYTGFQTPPQTPKNSINILERSLDDEQFNKMILAERFFGTLNNDRDSVFMRGMGLKEAQMLLQEGATTSFGLRTQKSGLGSFITTSPMKALGYSKSPNTGKSGVIGLFDKEIIRSLGIDIEQSPYANEANNSYLLERLPKEALTGFLDATNLKFLKPNQLNIPKEFHPSQEEIEYNRKLLSMGKSVFGENDIKKNRPKLSNDKSSISLYRKLEHGILDKEGYGGVFNQFRDGRGSKIDGILERHPNLESDRMLEYFTESMSRSLGSTGDGFTPFGEAHSSFFDLRSFTGLNRDQRKKLHSLSVDEIRDSGVTSINTVLKKELPISQLWGGDDLQQLFKDPRGLKGKIPNEMIGLDAKGNMKKDFVYDKLSIIKQVLKKGLFLNTSDILGGARTFDSEKEFQFFSTAQKGTKMPFGGIMSLSNYDFEKLFENERGRIEFSDNQTHNPSEVLKKSFWSELRASKKSPKKSPKLSYDPLIPSFSKLYEDYDPLQPNLRYILGKNPRNSQILKSQDSYLDFGLENENLNVGFLKSGAKGDGFAMFSHLVNKINPNNPNRSHRRIMSDSFAPQISRLVAGNPEYTNRYGKTFSQFTRNQEIINNSLENLSHENIIKTLFPQFRYREMQGLDTKFDMAIPYSETNQFDLRRLKGRNYQQLLETFAGHPKSFAKALKINNISSSFAGSGVIPNFNDLAGKEIDFSFYNAHPNNLIGSGQFRDFYKTDKRIDGKRVGLKRVRNRPGASLAERGEEAQFSFIMSKYLHGLNRPGSGLYFPNVFGSADQTANEAAIVEEMITNMTSGRLFNKILTSDFAKARNPMSRQIAINRNHQHKNLSATLAESLVMKEASKFGVLPNDLHTENFTINAKGATFIRKASKKMFAPDIEGLDQDDHRLDDGFMDAFAKSGGRISIIDPGNFEAGIGSNFYSSLQFGSGKHMQIPGQNKLLKTAFDQLKDDYYKRRVFGLGNSNLGTADGLFSLGMIPNFSKGVQAAIMREKAAGIDPSRIRIGQSSKLINRKNPQGIGVYNTKDEPMGINQGISRALREGVNPQTYNIPSFAPLKTFDLDFDPDEISKAMVKGFEKRMFDLLKSGSSSPTEVTQKINEYKASLPTSTDVQIELNNELEKLKNIIKSSSANANEANKKYEDVKQSINSIAKQYGLSETGVKQFRRSIDATAKRKNRIDAILEKQAKDLSESKAKRVSGVKNLVGRLKNKREEGFDRRRQFEEEALKAKVENAQFEALKRQSNAAQTTTSFFPWTQNYRDAQKLKSSSPDQFAIARNQRAQRLSGTMMGVSFALPMVAGLMQEGIGSAFPETKGGRVASSAVGSFANIVSTSATVGMMSGGNPWAVGAAALGTTAMESTKMFKEWRSNLPELSREFELVRDRTARSTEALEVYVNLTQKLESATAGLTSASVEQIRVMRSQRMAALSKIPIEERQKILSAVGMENLQGVAFGVSDNLNRQSRESQLKQQLAFLKEEGFKKERIGKYELNPITGEYYSNVSTGMTSFNEKSNQPLELLQASIFGARDKYGKNIIQNFSDFLPKGLQDGMLKDVESKKTTPFALINTIAQGSGMSDVTKIIADLRKSFSEGSSEFKLLNDKLGEWTVETIVAQRLFDLSKDKIEKHTKMVRELEITSFGENLTRQSSTIQNISGRNELIRDESNEADLNRIQKEGAFDIRSLSLNAQDQVSGRAAIDIDNLTRNTQVERDFRIPQEFLNSLESTTTQTQNSIQSILAETLGSQASLDVSVSDAIKAQAEKTNILFGEVFKSILGDSSKENVGSQTDLLLEEYKELVGKVDEFQPGVARQMDTRLRESIMSYAQFVNDASDATKVKLDELGSALDRSANSIKEESKQRSELEKFRARMQAGGGPAGLTNVRSSGVDMYNLQRELRISQMTGDQDSQFGSLVGMANLYKDRGFNLPPELRKSLEDAALKRNEDSGISGGEVRARQQILTDFVDSGESGTINPMIFDALAYSRHLEDHRNLHLSIQTVENDRFSLATKLQNIQKQIKDGTLDEVQALRLANVELTKNLASRAKIASREGLISSDELRDANRLARESQQITQGGMLTGAQLGESFFDGFEYNTKSFFDDVEDGVGNVANMMKDSFSGAFDSFVTGATSAKEALRDFGLEFLRSISKRTADISFELLLGGTTSLAKGLLARNKGGMIRGYSSGGVVEGGSGVKDDVFAFLTDGEYVIKKSAVNTYGKDFLDKVNSGQVLYDGKSSAVHGSTNRIDAVMANSFKVNDPRRPTEGNIVVDERLTSFALDDPDNPQNDLRFQKENHYWNYKKAEMQHKEELKQFKRAQRNSVMMAGVSAVMGIAGAGMGEYAKGMRSSKAAQGGGYLQYDLSKQNSYMNNQDLMTDFYRSGLSYKASGGMMNGKSSIDNIPTLLTGGEYVVKKSAVDSYGSEFFDKLNNGRIEKFASGGLVGSGSTGGAFPDFSRIENIMFKLNTSIENLERKISEKSSSSGGEIVLNITNNISVDQKGNSTQDSSAQSSGSGSVEGKKSMRELTEMISSTTKKVIVGEMRPGGLLSKSR